MSYTGMYFRQVTFFFFFFFCDPWQTGYLKLLIPLTPENELQYFIDGDLL
jgi:hypothetical protein